MGTSLIMLSRRYKKMIGRCTLLFLAGTALQFLVGRLDPSFLTYPWGLVLALNYLYLLIFLYTQTNKWEWVKGLYGREACVVSLASVLMMTLLFGLIRQDASSDGLLGKLGFTQMLSSWSFNFLLFHFMSVIGLKSIDDLWHWKRSRISTLLFHAALFVILVAGLFGSGDKVRVKVSVDIGKSVQMGVSPSGERVSLPFALWLKEFTMDEYPPRLYVASDERFSKHFVVVEEKGSSGTVDSWQIVCLDYIEMAGRMHQDSTYVPMKHVGSTSAAYVKATHLQTRESVEGWVSCGSHIFTGDVVSLPDGKFVVMPPREPKKYLSNVVVEFAGEKQNHQIAVNAPATIGSWKIYQSGYDRSRGKWSTTSVLECVKDAWYVPVQIALWLILGGGVWLVFFSWKERRKEGKK